MSSTPTLNQMRAQIEDAAYRMALCIERHIKPHIQNDAPLDPTCSICQKIMMKQEEVPQQ